MSESFTRQMGRSPLSRTMGVRILGTGSYLPAQVVTNRDLQARHGFDPDWIAQRTGIHERRVVADNEATSDLCAAAARQALDRAGVKPSEIDLILLATFTPDLPLPSAACRVQHMLGIRAPAMDIAAACSGFMYALVTGMQFIANGTARYVLVAGGESISRSCNPADQRTYPLFGDGAGAVVIGKGTPQQGFLAYTLGADGAGEPLINVPMGGSRQPATCPGIQNGSQFIYMDGRAVFKWAIRIVCDSVLDVVEAAGMGLNDVNLFVPHQANVRIIDAAIDLLGVDRRKVFINLDKYGNTSAASIPIALDEAVGLGRVQPGDLLLMSGFGAGLTWGTGLLRW